MYTPSYPDRSTKLMAVRSPVSIALLSQQAKNERVLLWGRSLMRRHASNRIDNPFLPTVTHLFAVKSVRIRPTLCFLCYGNRVETAINHVVELGASWLLLAPVRLLCMLGGGIQTAFQLAIIVSGNLSFLNHLTILPFVWCFDDR